MTETVATASWPPSHDKTTVLGTDKNCTASDRALQLAQDTVCVSLQPASTCPPGSDNVSAEHDWPNQVVYYNNVLSLVADPSTCLDTDTARNVVAWLDNTNVNTSAFWNTWLVFQVSRTAVIHTVTDRHTHTYTHAHAHVCHGILHAQSHTHTYVHTYPIVSHNTHDMYSY